MRFAHWIFIKRQETGIYFYILFLFFWAANGLSALSFFSSQADRMKKKDAATIPAACVRLLGQREKFHSSAVSPVSQSVFAFPSLVHARALSVVVPPPSFGVHQRAPTHEKPPVCPSFLKLSNIIYLIGLAGKHTSQGSYAQSAPYKNIILNSRSNEIFPFALLYFSRGRLTFL